MSAAALEWRGVSLRFKGFSIEDVTLELPRECWLSLVGPTGAGKTLLLEVATGFMSPSAGRMLRDGRDVTTAPPEQRGIGYVPQDDLLFPHLDVRSNLLFSAHRRGLDRAQLEAELARTVEELGLAHLLERRVQSLSGGEAQRVALGRASLSGADTLLLDECTSALDGETRRSIGDVLGRWRRERKLTLLMVTHDLAEAHRVADQVLGIEAGRLTGPMAER